jgi:hypothetical protein
VTVPAGEDEELLEEELLEEELLEEELLEGAEAPWIASRHLGALPNSPTP